MIETLAIADMPVMTKNIYCSFFIKRLR